MVVVVVAVPAWVDAMRRRDLSQQRTTVKWVSKPPDERLTCVEIKGSQVLQLEIAESWLRTFERALRFYIYSLIWSEYYFLHQTSLNLSFCECIATKQRSEPSCLDLIQIRTHAIDHRC